ncbi:hypothetical protein, partial [Sulfobacillus thermosulfidooxidans]|uniref:hypothetical protein n=1 Tax=Sulfobacillus thermosulfidooxidans TaxID=28034 RepID=UPI001A986BD1
GSLVSISTKNGAFSDDVVPWCRRGEQNLLRRVSCASRRKSAHMPEWWGSSPSPQTSRDVLVTYAAAAAVDREKARPASYWTWCRKQAHAIRKSLQASAINAAFGARCSCGLTPNI